MTIKRKPTDFQVTEVLSPALLDTVRPSAGPYVLYRLTKESLSTPEAINAVTRSLHPPKGALAYAGLKDKHACSSQHLTVACKGALTNPPKQAEGNGWQLERVGYVEQPIEASDIAANGFQIVVRGLTKEASRDMDEAARLLALPESAGEEGSRERTLRVVNYFGDQRFGSARHGHGFLARNLIRGDFEKALKLALAVPARKDHRKVKEFKRAVHAGWGRWKELLPQLRRCPERAAIERLAKKPEDLRGAFCALPYFFQQLCVYAYQSWLWNATARELVAHACGEKGTVLAAKDLFGRMLFPTADSVPEELVGLELPLLGYKSELKEPWGPVAEAVLAQEGITTAKLKIPRVRRPFFREEPRPLFAHAARFVCSKAKTETRQRLMRTVAFELPRGAYATVVLRALGQ